LTDENIATDKKYVSSVGKIKSPATFHGINKVPAKGFIRFEP
jgi:hypothetical protein